MPFGQCESSGDHKNSTLCREWIVDGGGSYTVIVYRAKYIFLVSHSGDDGYFAQNSGAIDNKRPLRKDPTQKVNQQLTAI